VAVPRLADRNIVPQIGSVKLKELTAERLDVWMDERASCRLARCG
jgi:hypothetical protein